MKQENKFNKGDRVIEISTGKTGRIVEALNTNPPSYKLDLFSTVTRTTGTEVDKNNMARFIETPCGTRSDEVTLNENELKLHSQQFMDNGDSNYGDAHFFRRAFEPGSIVQLKVGGPKMIISSNGSCVWSSSDGKPQEKRFDACVLKEIKTPHGLIENDITPAQVCELVNRILDAKPIKAHKAFSFRVALQELLYEHHSELCSKVFIGETDTLRDSYVIATKTELFTGGARMYTIAPSGK